MLLDDGAVGGAQFGARLLEIGARRKAAEQLRHPMHAAVHHRRVEMMGTGDDVGDDFSLGGIRHRRLDHADDGRGAIAQAASSSR